MEKPGQNSQMMDPQQEEARLKALQASAAAGGEDFMPTLFRCLGDPSWRVRKEAVEIFLSLPAVEQLAAEVIELLHSEDNAGLRNAAVEILVRLGRSAVPELLAELDCQDPDVRKFTLDILGDIGDDTVIRPMLNALGDSDDNVRSAAAENLGKIGDAEAVPALLEALDHPDLWFRFTVLEALGRIGEPVPVDSLLRYGEDPLLRKALYDCLGHIGGLDAVPLLVRGLSEENRNLREAAVLSLERLNDRHPETVARELAACCGGPSAEAVAGLLASHDADVRRAAVTLLGVMGDDRFAPRLTALFTDQALCESAVRALIRMGAEAVCPLVQKWREADLPTRTYLAYICGATGCREGLDLLLAGLDDGDPQLRQVAAQALGQLGAKEAIAPLVGRLGDEVEEVRETAASALSQIGDPFPEEVARYLHPHLEHEDPERRMGVVLVLGQLEGQSVENGLSLAMKDESPLVRQAAVRALAAKEGSAQLPSLMLALTDEDADVRRLAAEALGGLGDDQAVDPLGLALGDEDIWVRSAAARALGMVGGEGAVSLLRQALADPVGLVAIAALETIAETDFDNSYALIVQALDHEDEEVVNAALNLLVARGRRDWIDPVRSRLLDHPHWEVRATFVRALAELEGSDCLSLLEERLLVEGEELVRQQINDLVACLRQERG